MRYPLIAQLLMMALLFISCKVTRNQIDTPDSLGGLTNAYNGEEGFSNRNTFEGQVIDVKSSKDGSSYLFEVINDERDTSTFQLLPEVIAEEYEVSEFPGKIVSIFYTEMTEHMVYDIRLANDAFETSLHEVSTKNGHTKTNTYSIIGRYVFAEPRGGKVYLEIEGRYGQIYELSTEVTRSEWADEEVECAIYVIQWREANEILIKE